MDYGTVKRGKVRFEIGSDQDRFLHTKNIDHSHVHIEDGIKRITRYPKK